MKRSKLIMQAGVKEESFRKEVTDYLNDWLIKHVMGIDKELEDHIMNIKIQMMVQVQLCQITNPQSIRRNSPLTVHKPWNY